MHSIYIVLVFSFRAEAKLQKKTKKRQLFWGKGWTSSESKGMVQVYSAQLRVKLKVKGLQQEQHQDEAEARLEVEGFSMLPYRRSLCQSLS